MIPSIFCTLPPELFEKVLIEIVHIENDAEVLAKKANRLILYYTFQQNLPSDFLDRFRKVVFVTAFNRKLISSVIATPQKMSIFLKKYRHSITHIKLSGLYRSSLFFSFPKLEQLNLGHQELTSEEISFLSEMPNVKRLSLILKGNCQSVAEKISQLPLSEIHLLNSDVDPTVLAILDSNKNVVVRTTPRPSLPEYRNEPDIIFVTLQSLALFFIMRLIVSLFRSLIESYPSPF